MGLWPACAGTQTGAPQRMETPHIPQPWGDRNTPPELGAGGRFPEEDGRLEKSCYGDRNRVS